ncbi:enoyl-CoA hydratase/isomerase family protein [Microvirga antarctica]|uniref:enoyl-CoA hydratase/isomerase family protein n=1 Tax=Microvirga antarctica TaxID=2819233 RepID=UPI001B30E198|nr:enoyl-CoA hydratase-related protein [Microvirga antarctica]
MLRFEIDDGIARLTMCNPPVNALSRAWGDHLCNMLDELEARDDWRVLVIASDQKVFSAGGDIKQYADRLDTGKAGELLAVEARYFQGLFARIAALPQISIAEIAGVAAGGGMELALACDLRVAAKTTRLGLPEVGVGLLPAAGGTQRLTKLCGRGIALRLIAGAELVSGEEALQLGLVEWIAVTDEIRETTDRIARRLAEMPPEALRAAKACITAADDPSCDGYAFELSWPSQLMESQATRDSIRKFLSKRK